MTTRSYKFGNGLLLLGSAPLDVTGQMTKFSVNPKENVETIEAIPLLDDTEIAEETEATFDYTISGTLLQDLNVAGVIEWSWNEAGTEQDFVFIPDIPTDRGVQGVCYPVPLTIGGEVTKPKNRPTADFEWRVKGKPTFGVYDEVDDEVDEDV